MPHSIEVIASTRKKTKESIRVDSLFPSELRPIAENLINLLQDYYTHINEIGQASGEINSMVNARDIDITKEQYLDLIQKEIASVIPKDIVSNRVNLYKNLAKYYNVRGSKESIELFFKIIFQDNAEIYFPRNDMLIASDGVWLSDIVKPVFSNVPLMGIIGNGIGAKATVVTSNGAIRKINVNSGGSNYPCPTATIVGTQTSGGVAAVLEVYVADGKIQGVNILNAGTNYTAASVVFSDATGVNAAADVQITDGKISFITITNRGSGYSCPTVSITDSTGSDAEAIVYCLGGKIDNIRMTQFGHGYTNSPNIVINAATGSGAVTTPIVVDGAITAVVPSGYGTNYTTAKVVLDGVVINNDGSNLPTEANIIPVINRSTHPGEIRSYIIADCGQGYSISGNLLGYSTGTYNQSKGFVSDRIKLQDSYFYQKFSYVVRTGNNLEAWENIFNKLVHPAGMIFFGEVLILLQFISTGTLRIPTSMRIQNQPGLISAEDIAQIIILQALNNLIATHEFSQNAMVMNVPNGINTANRIQYSDLNTISGYANVKIQDAATLYPYGNYSIQEIINTAEQWPTGFNRSLYIGTQTWNGSLLGINFY